MLLPQENSGSNRTRELFRSDIFTCVPHSIVSRRFSCPPCVRPSRERAENGRIHETVPAIKRASRRVQRVRARDTYRTAPTLRMATLNPAHPLHHHALTGTEASTGYAKAHTHVLVKVGDSLRHGLNLGLTEVAELPRHGGVGHPDLPLPFLIFVVCHHRPFAENAFDRLLDPSRHFDRAKGEIHMTVDKLGKLIISTSWLYRQSQLVT